MPFTYWGCPVIVLGYFGEKVLIRMPRGGAPVWVGMEYIK
jgi:hypothetical protein